MKFKFISNACGIFIGSKGTKILCDPWVNNGVFEGSWYHYPPIKTRIKNLQNVSAIYLSHIHPDHYDERYFSFSKNIPIILLNEGPNFLKKNLIKKGYNNLIEIKHNETVNFNEFNLTMFKPFTKHLYEESLLGNLIDSSLVLNEGKITAINFNDNTPDINACKILNEKFTKIDLALLNFNAAGPYPSCFNNLSINQKKNEHKRIINRNLEHLYKTITVLKPKSVLPFAGAYVLGGKNFYKNDYLGTTTWDECSDYLKKKLKFKSNIICLRENQTFDLKKQKSLEKYKKIDLNRMKKYIRMIGSKKYEYEKDKTPKLKNLLSDIKIASIKMLDRLKGFNVNLNTNVYIEIANKKIRILKGKEKNQKLYCSMDPKLLRRILDKKSHWNNAEIGAHINFRRYPNKMDPDVHTCLSFFHL